MASETHDIVTSAEEQERKEQVKREQRYKVEQQMQRHLERLAMALEGLADAADKAEQASYALLIRREYGAARKLVPAHRALDGSYYNVTFTPFSDLYRD